MKRIRANGVDFAYLEAGTGPLVLLVHGFPDTAHGWDRVLPAVAEAGFRAVAPNTRGYYPTSIPEDGRYDAETLGRDIVALIEALGEQQAIVVGHDFGAAAAFAAATLAPERVKLLVTVAIAHPASLKPSPRMLWNVRHFFALGRKHAAAKIRKTNYAYIDTLVRRWSPAWRDLPASETAHVKEAFAQPGCLEAACAYYAAISPRLPEAHRKRISVPSVAFAGEDDILPPRAYEKARTRYTGSYEVVQVPGGHFMHREHPETFIPELVRVLRDHQARAARAS